jgi:hypothetical protein
VSGVDEHAEAHRLKTELGYGARRIGKELGISRYAAEQLLAQPVAEPVAVEVRPVAEPVGQVADEVAEPAAAAAVGVADQAPARRVLVIDLDRFPGLAEDLELLQRTGAATEDVVNFAVDKLAGVYRQARARGLLRDGQAFDVKHMWLRPRPYVRQAS